MKFLAVSVLGWVLVPLLAFAQEKVELNTITGVKVSGSTVEITGTKKPNFTTFTMTDPPRLVIDISEAVLKDVPGETRVNNGLITGLRAANYGSDSSAIARVLIGYDRDVETDIQVNGSVLVVKVLEGGAPAVAQTMPEPVKPSQPTPGQTVASAEPGTQQPTQPTQQEPVAQAKPSQNAEAAAKAEREAQQAEAAAAAKKAEEDRRKQEEAERAEAAKKAEEERRAQALATAEEKKRKEDEARAAEEARKQAALEEKKRKEEEARAEAEAKRQQEADEKKRRAEEAEQKRLAAAEEKKQKQEEAREAAEEKKQEAAEEKKRRAEEAEQKRLAAAEEKKHRAEEVEQKRQADLEEKKRKEEEARAARVASAESSHHAEPESPSSASVSGRHKILELVGFQQQAAGSRVYVRTNEPVSYKVSEGRNEIVLMLENTQIGKGNNTRALDTSFFDTAVAHVDPTVGPDRTVRVSIKLKEQVPVQTHQDGNTISLEFPRPPR